MKAKTAVTLLAAVLAIGCGKDKGGPGSAQASATAAASGEGQGKPGIANKAGRKAGAAAAGEAKTEAKTEAPKGPPKNVLLWHAYRDKEREALDTLIDTWNKAQPQVQVKALAVPFDALIDKLQVAVPRGNGPDLLIFAHDKIGTWARDGLIQPLGAWATPARLKRFLPQTVKPLVFERAVYGLPMAFKSLVLFYNKKLVPDPPETMAELVEVAAKHTSDEDGTFGLAYDAADLYQHAAFLHAYGGAVWDDKAGRLTIDTPQAVEALKAARALHKKHKIVPKGMTGFVITAMFNDGKVPMVFNGPWFIPEIDPGVRWGVALLPKADNGQRLQPYLGSEAVMLSAKTAVRDAALRVLDYLTSDEAALTRFTRGKQLVANAKIYENPKWAGDPVVKVFRAQADHAVPMPNAVEANVVWQPYGNALREVIYGDAKPEEALKAAQAEAEAALAKLKKR